MERARDVVLIRHGETSWSASGKHTGRTDVPLTKRGRRQAADLGATVAGWRFALALTSPLQRAAETARLAGLSCTAEDDLQEWDYGELEGLTTPEIREDLPGWTIWRGPVPGGEGVAEVAARVDRVIERVQAVDGDVVLVSHGHLLRALAARWLEWPAVEGRRLVLDTATLGVLGNERGSQAILRWNMPPPAT
ncbi:acid phosphatase [soil metagenome]